MQEIKDSVYPCGHQKWQHDLYDGECPPPPLPNECCGAEASRDVQILCENGCCVEWYCGRCGVFTGMAAGPVRCGCMSDTGKYHQAYAERPMVPSSRGKKYDRRYRRNKPYRHRVVRST